MIERRTTREIKVGTITMGGNAPIVIQSMTNTKTKDAAATIAQIQALQAAGCALVRCSVPDMDSARALAEIKKAIDLPLVADIHFDYKLAIAAVENGADKLRINPGNIGGRERIAAVVDAAKAHRVPIRVGVNGGSLEKDILSRYGAPTAEALVESALRNVALLQEMDFHEMVISIKSSNVPLTIAAYELLAQRTDFPLHLGITEAGTAWAGGIKSAVGIGSILSRGIGDTIRVSLTESPVEEIRYARQILKSLGYKGYGPEVISCPTCARTGIDLIPLAAAVERRLSGINKDIKVAVMGCVVNGPGEAKEADIGIAAGEGCGVIFKKGEMLGKFNEDEIIDALFDYIEEM